MHDVVRVSTLLPGRLPAGLIDGWPGSREVFFFSQPAGQSSFLFFASLKKVDDLNGPVVLNFEALRPIHWGPRQETIGPVH